MERIIDILESTPIHKIFIKDAVCEEIPQVPILIEYMVTSCKQLQEPTKETPISAVNKAETITLFRLVRALVKNHPLSQ